MESYKHIKVIQRLVAILNLISSDTFHETITFLDIAYSIQESQNISKH